MMNKFLNRLAYYIIAIFFSVSYVSQAFSQSNATLPTEGIEITKAIVSSPDAAALGKYGSIPISNYTGVPNISIPLYTIKTGSISLPISISYHAGGNKLEEMASSVGLGWTLNAGGVITRTIRGIADEEASGLLASAHYVPNIIATINGGNNYSSSDLNLYLNSIADGTIDGEADMYNFNFAGYSGRFTMDSYGNIMVMPQQKIKFTFTNNGTDIMTFKAVTPDGTTYVFGNSGDGNVAVEKTYPTSSCSLSTDKKYYATSWFIKSITDATGHQVTFNYTSENYAIKQTQSDTQYQYDYSSEYQSMTGDLPIPSMPETICNASNSIYGVKLSSINFENGSVAITSNTTRKDLSNSKLIDAVNISGSTFSKSYQFYYKNSTAARLRLDSLVSVLPSDKERYSFSYNADSWNPNNMYHQDFWGYDNGHTENITLVPSTTFTSKNSASSTPTVLPGANRSANEQAMMSGLLTQITYPTGGYTQFSYEANTETNIDVAGTSSRYPAQAERTGVTNDPSNEFYDSDTNGAFNVTSSSGNAVAVSVQGSNLQDAGNADPNTNDITANLYKLDSSGNPITSNSYAITNIGATYNLSPGTYKIVVTDGKHKAYSSSNPNGIKYSIAATWQEPYRDANGNDPLYKNYIVGGVRIQQIADYDGISPIPVNLKTYKYTMPGITYSSGWLDFEPAYTYELGVNSEQEGVGYYTSWFFTRTATSNYPLATTQGSVVGYSHVEELLGANAENGKNEYFYVNSQAEPDGTFGYAYPFPPAMNHDWKRGLLLHQITWKSNGNQSFAKTKEKIYVYSSMATQFTNDIKAAFNPKPAKYSRNNEYYNNSSSLDGSIEVDPYTDFSDFTYLSSDTTKIYGTNGSSTPTVTWNSFQYDTTAYQLTQTQSVNSRKELLTQTVTYPYNYTSNSTTGSMKGIVNLQSTGILSYPIEEVVTKANADGSNVRTVKAVLTTYKPTTPLRDSVYELRSLVPVASFTSSSAGTTAIKKDSHYQPAVSFDAYDSFGNILQEKTVNGQPRSYIWGYSNTQIPYNNTNPIAEVLNANAADIAYTNFESYPVGSTAVGYGNWTYSNAATVNDVTAPMGSYCYTLSSDNNITKSRLTSSVKYIISFWAKQGGSIQVSGGTITASRTGMTISGWTYFEYQCTGTTSVTIKGTGIIDELRLYPFTAQMSTYAYIPLIGISLKCDSKSQFTYYNYDTAGRLTNIKDQNGKILKHYDYHYQGQ